MLNGISYWLLFGKGGGPLLLKLSSGRNSTEKYPMFSESVQEIFIILYYIEKLSCNFFISLKIIYLYCVIFISYHIFQYSHWLYYMSCYIIFHVISSCIFMSCVMSYVISYSIAYVMCMSCHIICHFISHFIYHITCHVLCSVISKEL